MLAQPSAPSRPTVPFESVVAPAALPHPVFRASLAAAEFGQGKGVKAGLAETDIAVNVCRAMHGYRPRVREVESRQQ